jgi:transposase
MTSNSSGRSPNLSADPSGHVESPVRGQLARRVRRAGTGKPTAETLYGVPSPTQQVQALDRTQPVLPIAVDVSEQRTHDYVRHGTTNLFAALNVGTGEIYGECKATRNGADFLAFLKAAVRLHEGKDVHFVLDNLSTHATPVVRDWLANNPRVTFHFTPTGSSWINQIEIWFGIITRQAIRRGTFASVRALVARIRDYICHWNANPKPFVWTATADEILAKVRLVQSNIKKLVDNNAK